MVEPVDVFWAEAQPTPGAPRPAELDQLGLEGTDHAATGSAACLAWANESSMVFALVLLIPLPDRLRCLLVRAVRTPLRVYRVCV